MDSGRLVFVAGLHRSGTTPLARLLSAHPEISGFHDTGVKEDEGQHLQQVYPAARQYGGAGRFAFDPRSHLTEDSPLATPENARLLLAQWSPHWDLDRRLLLEKSPPNLVMTRFLQALYPEARFVVVVRHPVVVALSTRKWSGPTHGLDDLLRHWVRAHDTFLADLGHLKHVHVVRYEELVADPATTLAGVADFLGLAQPIDAGSLDGRRSDGYLRTWTELTGSRSPITRRRVDRLRRRYAADVARFGYDFDDLTQLGAFPDPHGGVGADPAGRLQVLYVGGMPRSGSTLTDLMLHQLPGHVGVGELFYLWRNGLAHDGLCACSQPFSGCPFWSEVGRVAFGGWESVDAEHVMRLQEQVDRTSRIPWLLSPWRPRVFAAELEEYAGILRRLYAAIVTVSGQQVVVDSSKRPSLAYVLRSMPDVDLAVAHVVRDPRGVAFSFAKHVALPAGAALRSEMPRSTTRKVSRRWVSVNALIAGLRRVGVPVVRVRYEDLVAAPDRELRRVLALTGQDAPESTFDYVTPEGITVPRTHVVAGGRIRLASGTMPLRLDEQWQRDMPSRSRRLVEVMTAPVRWKYGYS
ncbi:sulfotransferase [Nocardioides sp. MAHUQ-72]|uniref:sulfotransferase n=1 Tax=unclassified Nocardioides TaxID=2615069 RepID=UPI0036159620